MNKYTATIWVPSHSPDLLKDYENNIEKLVISNCDMSTSGWIKVGTITGEATMIPNEEINGNQKQIEKIKSEIENTQKEYMEKLAGMTSKLKQLGAV